MIGAYNEERHIRASVESVLAQTFPDFELLVIDDGSTDRTSEILHSIRDPRMRVIRQENHGPSHAYNRAVTEARAEIIAAMSGNDECVPTRLERQLAELERQKHDVLVSWVEFIDESGHPPPPHHFARDFFNHPHRDRPAMLNWFFYRGNYLNDITMMIRRSVYDQVGFYRPTAFELHDFDLWIRIVGTYEVGMLPEPLVRFRIMAENQNISNPTRGVRSTFECYQVYRRFFDAIGPELFRRAFHDRLRKPDFTSLIDFELEKSFLYLGHQVELVRGVGLERLFEQLQDPEILERAHSEYEFGLAELDELTQCIDWTRHRQPPEIPRPQQDATEPQPSAGGAPTIFVASSDRPSSHASYSGPGHALPFPSPELMGTVGASDAENFMVVGDTWYQIVASALRQTARADTHLLDLGCGCGRLARYLLRWPNLRYTGIDLFRSSIEWCNDHLKPVAPERFQFIFFDGYSAHYNPEGSTDAAAFALPLPNGVVDMVVAASLYTHLTLPAVQQSLAESARVLAPGGVLVASILTDRAPPNGYAGDEFRADIDFAYFLTLARSVGLEFREDHGILCGERVVILFRA